MTKKRLSIILSITLVLTVVVSAMALKPKTVFSNDVSGDYVYIIPLSEMTSSSSVGGSNSSMHPLFPLVLGYDISRGYFACSCTNTFTNGSTNQFYGGLTLSKVYAHSTTHIARVELPVINSDNNTNLVSLFRYSMDIDFSNIPVDRFMQNSNSSVRMISNSFSFYFPDSPTSFYIRGQFTYSGYTFYRELNLTYENTSPTYYSKGVITDEFLQYYQRYYDDGYRQGLRVGSDPEYAKITPLRMIANGVSDLLNLQIIPNTATEDDEVNILNGGITLGMLLALGLGMLLLGFIMKVFLGG